MQTQESTSTRTSLKIPQVLSERLDNLAQARNRSKHSLMLQALEAYADREEKREALRREARAAHEQFEQTGLHLTNAEVIDWMDKIIRGEKEPLPPCHI